MYKLDDDVQWTTELKNAFKHNVTRAKILWSGTEINEQNYIQNLTLDEQRYISNLGFVGSATAKKLEINLIDNSNSINLENQEIILKLGADYNGDTYYINYGNFIVDKPPEIDTTNGKIRVVAYDYMIKFNKPYINRVAYPCSLLDLLQDVCSQAEVVLGSNDFANKNFTVQDNQFEGATLREVLQNIAKCAFSWARIGQDNKLYLDFDLTVDNTETITIDDYKTNSFKKANEYYGPINQVTYADSNMEGQEERVKDQESIDENGLKELVIYDNLFAYTPAKRQQLIQAGTRLLGLEYMPISQLELIGLAYLDCCDIINVETLDNETFISRVFSHKIKYTGILTDGIITEGTSDNEEAYKNTAVDVFQNQQTRIIVDKANRQIQSVVEEVAGQNQKISEITQTVDEIRAEISDIADMTTSQESTNAKIQLENIAESEPITIRVRPTGSNISLLYPNSQMFPSSNLYMKTRTMRFTNLSEYMQTQDEKYTSYKRYYSYDGTSYTLLIAGTDYVVGNVIVGTKYENVYVDYELPMNLLWYDADNYDEFFLDYDSQTCQVKKRVQYNANGTTSLLAQETVYNFTYPHIYLDEGNYEIELLGYGGAYIFVRLMVKNIYGAQWATKAELSSAISQTKSEITADVSQTLTGYSTTEQTEAAINIKAGEISSQVLQTYETKSDSNTKYSTVNQSVNGLRTEVAQTYETKSASNTKYSTINQTINGVEIEVGQKYNTSDFTNAKITAKINDGTSNVSIRPDKISLAGKTIQLTSDNIRINSTNFNVDKNGNMSCSNANVSGTITSSNATITGGSVVLNGYSGSQLIKVQKNNSNSTMSYLTPDVIAINGNGDYVELGCQGTPSVDVFRSGSTGTYITHSNVTTPQVIQTSKESVKKNIKKYLDNAIDIVKQSEIYKYNFKDEQDTDKKHIGFVIGDEGGNYKTPNEVISKSGEGIEHYTMTSILWKAVQEQQEIIEGLQKEIKELKGVKVDD